jgi:hypothetical protein
MILDPEDTSELWPVYKGASFDLWNPDTGDYYAWAKPDHVCAVLQEKRQNQQRLARSVVSELPDDVVKDAATLPCRAPRIAFRDVARATDTRTVHAALVPPRVVLANQAPYLLFARGDARDEAYVLGVMSSIPLDWYARRYVETHVNFHVLYPFPIPSPPTGDAVRRRIEEIAGQLAAIDERYADWAAAVGVPVGGANGAEGEDLVAELDAAVALLYGLDEDDVTHIFETFHVGWDYTERLQMVLEHFNRLRSQP